MVNLESSEKAYGVSLGNIRDRGGQPIVISAIIVSCKK